MSDLLAIFGALFVLIVTLVACLVVLLWGIAIISKQNRIAALKGDDK